MKILYSVCGRGMGHAVRSKPILEHLTKKNKVKIFSSGRAYSYLRKNFNDVNEIQDFHTRYKNNCVNEFGTILINIFNFPKIKTSFTKLLKVIDRFKPDIVVSDLEAISANAAFSKGIPVISVSNMDLFDKTSIKYQKKYFLNFKKLLNRLTIPYAKYCFVTTFFYLKAKSKDTFVVPPILRNEIINMKTKEGAYFLVYQSSETNKKLIETLKKIDEKFIVYGFNKDKTDKNLILRKFNEKIFFNDLANCKAVITNGGFTLMSEALHLGKPILSIPLRRNFEQIINGIYLNELGYGENIKFTREKHILNFINNLDKYKKKLKKYRRKDNSKILRKLDILIKNSSSERQN